MSNEGDIWFTADLLNGHACLQIKKLGGNSV